ncbi:MAG: amidohydrolase family protein [Clostridiales bacterium]|jgi:predicted TIM-barrel fold metal-dependent hydrolase|nr:amidohydrolase family protein [Clostridiales bacterium]
MYIIDAHTHIFPEKIAAKATEGIGKFYGLAMKYVGTAENLLKAGQKAGVSKFLVNSVATAPAQVAAINNFIVEQTQLHSEFIGFATIHQDMENMEEEISRVINLGLKGVKLHPDFQRFQFDNPRLHKLYALLEGRLPLLVHAGDKRFDFSGPQRIAAVLDKFPKLDVICAHFGGWSEWENAEKVLAGRRIWVDTSSSFAFLSPEKAVSLINAFGEDRVIFGTDFPMWDACGELTALRALNLPDKTMEKILNKNISNLLALE